MKIDSEVEIKLRERNIYDKVQNARFGLFVAREWKRLISPYTPRKNGPLEDTARIRPFEIEYVQPYSHYMYEGVIYEDPVFHFSGLFDKESDKWFSRPGVKKVPRQSGKTEFNYLRDANPHATHHWDKAAEKAGQKDKLIKSINEYLARR